MIRTEETEAIRYKISVLKDKIELKKDGYFEQGTTLDRLEASLKEAETELEQAILKAQEENYNQGFDISET
jgi:hypothetical protein